MALIEDAQSVAFPAIGTSALGFPVDVAARSLYGDWNRNGDRSKKN